MEILVPSDRPEYDGRMLFAQRKVTESRGYPYFVGTGHHGFFGIQVLQGNDRGKNSCQSERTPPKTTKGYKLLLFKKVNVSK
jgi:hypothetical protein